MRPEVWSFGSIADDRTHGATFLAARAAETLLAVLDSGGDLRSAAMELVQAQPAMASIFTLANRVLLAGTRVREVVEEALSTKNLDKAAEIAANLIGDGSVVLTHSHSEAVERTLLKAQARGFLFRVMITESRPLREGVTLARSLVEKGIPVRVIADAAVGRLLPEASLVLIGADSVSPHGIVNKIGTSLIALAAREHRKPIHVVCTSDKFIPFAGSDRLRAPEEIVPERIAGVSVTNYYYDATRLSLLTSLITERGVSTPEQLVRELASIDIHPDLLK